MYRIWPLFQERILAGEIPLVYCLIETAMGTRAYGEKEFSAVIGWDGYIADGSWLADGSITAGGYFVGSISKEARVLSWGKLERTIQPRTRDVLSAMNHKQLQHLTITMDNSDFYFSKIIPKEAFLARNLTVYVGFDSIPLETHLKPFTGTISEIRLDSMGTRITFEAVEDIEPTLAPMLIHAYDYASVKDTFVTILGPLNIHAHDYTSIAETSVSKLYPLYRSAKDFLTASDSAEVKIAQLEISTAETVSTSDTNGVAY